MTSSIALSKDVSFVSDTQLELAPPDMKKYVGHTLASLEKQLVLSTLTRCGGNRTMAADILGISLLDLRDRLQKYADNYERSMTPSEQELCEKEAMLTRLKDYDPGNSPPS